jgi:peptide deformylase
MVREVRLLGDPVLRRKAKPVAELDSGVRTLINDLFDTMYKEEGVGLAAPQVGISERVIVIDPHDPEVQPFALVNPRIVQLGEEVDRGEEGCLSLPGLKDIVERPATVVVEGIGGEGQPLHIEASGLLARILQHEIDHLDGILFVDRVSPLKRKLLLKKWQKVKPTAPA